MNIDLTKTTPEIETIKHFLLSYQISQRFLQKIKKGEVQVLLAGQPVKLTSHLQENQVVTLALPAETNNLAAANQPLDIIYEDQNWLVLNKPAGISSVIGPTNQTTTMVNMIKGYFLKQGLNDMSPHVITRLDRFTSGIMLVAKHSLAQGMINYQVEQHQFEKEYLALVSGGDLPTHGFYDQNLGRIEGTFRYGIVKAPAGKTALSEYWVEETYAHATLVKVKLHTGRTHQIRAHFQQAGHPLLGDELYFGDLSLIQRQALHANRLSFYDPFSKKQLTFKQALPQDMVQAREQLLKSVE